MKMGFYKQSIVPSFPLLLAGFAKERIANEVLDDVYVKVIVVEVNQKLSIIVSYDLVGVSESVVKQLQAQLVMEEVAIENIVVCATHTHSSFGGAIQSDSGLLKGTQYIFTEYDKTRVEHVVNCGVQAIRKAIDTMQEGSVYVASDTMHAMGSNRNDQNKKGDPTIQFVYFKQHSGKQVVLYHYACHPTILNHENEKVSGDFVSGVETLANQDGYYFAMFLNGSCGDISTRFTRQKTGYPELERYALLLYKSIKQNAIHSRKVDNFTLTCKTLSMTLKKKQAEPLAKAQANLQTWQQKVEEAKQQQKSAQEIRVLESYKEGAMLNVTLAQNATPEKEYTFSVSIWTVNAYSIVWIPGELFSELSNQIKNPHILFATYANGYLGYFADQNAYDKHYYEAMSSPFAKGEAEKMMLLIEETIKNAVE